MKKIKTKTSANQSITPALATQPIDYTPMPSQSYREPTALGRILEAMGAVELYSTLVAKGICDDSLAELGRANRKYIQNAYGLSPSQAKNIKDLCRPAAIANGWFEAEDDMTNTSGSEENDQSLKSDQVGISSTRARPKNFIHLNIVKAKHSERRVSPKNIA